MPYEPHDHPSEAYLVVQQGPQAGKRLEIWKDCTTLGRSRERDIFIEDITVHRKQASIIKGEEGYMLCDDHGSGDSFVNDVPAHQPLPLKNGDQLRFGSTQLTFFTNEATRPIPLASSRGRELHIGRKIDPHSSAIAQMELASMHGSIRNFDLMPEMTIGRSRECSIFLEDLAVSRLHATIHQLPDGSYEIMDNNSATGTYINGQPVRSHPLSEGDTIQIGSNRLTFRMGHS